MASMTPDGQPTPALAPPPGITSNFLDPVSIYWKIPAVTGPFLALSIFFCALRLYTSGFVTKRWRWDDALIAIAQVLCIGKSAIDLSQGNNGLGRHMWDITASQYTAFMKLGSTGGQPTYTLSLMCTKLSILMFYLRFPSSKLFKAAAYLVMLLAVGNGVSAALSVVYLCKPIPKNWDPSIDGSCGDGMVLFWATAVLNMSTDILILMLPFWLLKPLQLPPRRMFGVALILMSGGFVTALTIVRVVEIPKAFGVTDYTWVNINNFMWVAIEMNVAIVCACLPCLPAFAKRHFANSCLFRACTRYTITQLPTTFRRRWRGPSPPSTINEYRVETEKQHHVVEQDLENQAGK